MKIRMPQLHEILEGIAFIMFVLGMAAIEREMIFTPAALFLVGLGFLYWAAREDGSLNRRRRK